MQLGHEIFVANAFVTAGTGCSCHHFSGNPAAIVIVRPLAVVVAASEVALHTHPAQDPAEMFEWPPDRVLQQIAAQHSFSETAFILPQPSSVQGEYLADVRWFTPKCEVELCGHATFAAGFVLLKLFLDRYWKHKAILTKRQCAEHAARRHLTLSGSEGTEEDPSPEAASAAKSELVPHLLSQCRFVPVKSLGDLVVKVESMTAAGLDLLSIEVPAILPTQCIPVSLSDPLVDKLCTILPAENVVSAFFVPDGIIVLHLWNEDAVKAVCPNFARLVKLSPHVQAVVVTARANVTSPAAVGSRLSGETADIVCRFFAPGFGIDEDPVTASAHAVLAPYWARYFTGQQFLGTTTIRSRQLSARGGFLTCFFDPQRTLVRLMGRCSLFMHGCLSIDCGNAATGD